MKYLLDASIIIFALSGSATELLRQRMAACDEDDIVTSAIAFSEVARGSWNGKSPSLFVLDQFSQHVPVLPFDLLAAKYYADLPFKRASYDRLVAAHALSLDLTLVTNNDRDFDDVPGLLVEDWTQAR